MVRQGHTWHRVLEESCLPSLAECSGGLAVSTTLESRSLLAFPKGTSRALLVAPAPFSKHGGREGGPLTHRHLWETMQGKAERAPGEGGLFGNPGHSFLSKARMKTSCPPPP